MSLFILQKNCNRNAATDVHISTYDRIKVISVISAVITPLRIVQYLVLRYISDGELKQSSWFDFSWWKGSRRVWVCGFESYPTEWITNTESSVKVGTANDSPTLVVTWLVFKPRPLPLRLPPPDVDPSIPNVQVTQMTLLCESAPSPLVLDLTGEFVITWHKVFGFVCFLVFLSTCQFGIRRIRKPATNNLQVGMPERSLIMTPFMTHDAPTVPSLWWLFTGTTVPPGGHEC